MSRGKVQLLDYGAGNVRSLRNAIKSLNFEVIDLQSAEDIATADCIIFPGVGSFGQAMESLRTRGWIEPLKEYLRAGKPFFGICLGMQSLFEGSEESPGAVGLGIIPGVVTRFLQHGDNRVSVPQIGWNGITAVKPSCCLENININNDKVYFVHSFCALPIEANLDWVLTVTDYGSQKYISMIQKGNVVATQFHPEKSGRVGLAILESFLSKHGLVSNKISESAPLTMSMLADATPTCIVKRVIACLDVRSNDAGDLIVTKGDQYDVREESTGGRGDVRNLGKPVALCKRYYEDGADEIVFLNITSFRQGVIDDLPMLQVLEHSSENVFVPLTVGGGIREYVDPQTGISHSALDVASRYFRAGADKVSIGGDAVYAVEEYLNTKIMSGASSIEQISKHYGAQAVVVSIDPKRVYVATADDPSLSNKNVIKLRDGEAGPNGEEYCWWQVTVKGGRETRDLDAITLAKVCELLGAGEIMLNCIDMDGQGNGYDIPLVRAVQSAVGIPVISSSGAGAARHFSEVFRETGVLAALAAGIFHRNEVKIEEVKRHLVEEGIPSRN